MKTALICHHDDELNQDALPRWLASFSEMVGVVSIVEGKTQKRRRIKREIKRVGYLRFLDVLAYRIYHRLFLRAGDLAYERALLQRMRDEFPALPADLPIL